MASYNRTAVKVKNNKKNAVQRLLKINIILTILILLSHPTIVSLAKDIVAEIQR